MQNLEENLLPYTLERTDKELLFKIKHFLISRERTLSTAESCTGGYLSSFLSLLPGSSDFFKGGIVTYQTEVKIDVLGVDKGIVEKFGVVSEEMSIEMAKRVKEKLNSYYGISVTGNLGPSVLENKRKGLVYSSVYSEEGILSKRFLLSGTRSRIRDLLILNILKLFFIYLEREET